MCMSLEDLKIGWKKKRKEIVKISRGVQVTTEVPVLKAVESAMKDVCKLTDTNKRAVDLQQNLLGKAEARLKVVDKRVEELLKINENLTKKLEEKDALLAEVNRADLPDPRPEETTAHDGRDEKVKLEHNLLDKEKKLGKMEEFLAKRDAEIQNMQRKLIDAQNDVILSKSESESVQSKCLQQLGALVADHTELLTELQVTQPKNIRLKIEDKKKNLLSELERADLMQKMEKLDVKYKEAKRLATEFKHKLDQMVKLNTYLKYDLMQVTTSADIPEHTGEQHDCADCADVSEPNAKVSANDIQLQSNNRTNDKQVNANPGECGDSISSNEVPGSPKGGADESGGSNASLAGSSKGGADESGGSNVSLAGSLEQKAMQDTGSLKQSPEQHDSTENTNPEPKPGKDQDWVCDTEDKQGTAGVTHIPWIN